MGKVLCFSVIVCIVRLRCAKSNGLSINREIRKRNNTPGLTQGTHLSGLPQLICPWESKVQLRRW